MLPEVRSGKRDLLRLISWQFNTLRGMSRDASSHLSEDKLIDVSLALFEATGKTPPTTHNKALLVAWRQVAERGEFG